MSVHIGGDQLKVVDSVTDPVNKSTTAPENDWAILIAAKPKCGTPYRVLDPFQLTQADIPNSGLPVQMVCYHHDNAVLRNRLATEQCRLYPTGQKFDGLYRSKIGQPVGLHSCRVNLGTSGCPLVVDDGSGLKFIGTQIETHIRTGAGVARLFSEAYQQGLSRALSAMDNAENARGQISLASTR